VGALRALAREEVQVEQNLHKTGQELHPAQRTTGKLGAGESEAVRAIIPVSLGQPPRSLTDRHLLQLLRVEAELVARLCHTQREALRLQAELLEPPVTRE